MSKTRGLADAKLIALQAEDHYIRVITDRGDDLVLYRFGDALAEVSALQGLRVHRSYWIARDAIAAVEFAAKTYSVVLSNGRRVPVSRSYIALLRSSGLIQT
jgi:DNA-binding LytR/AlgR family response regulator